MKEINGTPKSVFSLATEVPKGTEVSKGKFPKGSSQKEEICKKKKFQNGSANDLFVFLSVE